jgi:hypothetical protein
LVQNTVIIVYEQILLGKFVLSSSLTTYIYGIAKNLWLKELRKKRKLVVIHIDEVDIESENQEDLTENRLYQLQKAIEELDVKCREILKSRYWQNLRFDEMSQLYNTTIASLKMKSSNLIIDYINGELSNEQKIKFEERLIQENDLVDSLRFQKEIRQAFVKIQTREQVISIHENAKLLDRVEQIKGSGISKNIESNPYFTSNDIENRTQYV